MTTRDAVADAEAPREGHEDTESVDMDPAADVSALRTSPERTLFTEERNADGWISTDLTVELRR